MDFRDYRMADYLNDIPYYRFNNRQPYSPINPHHHRRMLGNLYLEKQKFKRAGERKPDVEVRDPETSAGTGCAGSAARDGKNREP